ncbi:helix-turn-helix domain-containing protein [Aquirufa salirivi]|uniref:Helix-turn-helix transcriptional regulator n=1 Tax=Aquirufa salirivi TaxID=3104729 RepID=A0ABW8RVM6_9BACT
MPAINQIILPKFQRILVELGENIKLARLRRRLSAAQVAERAGISRPTLVSIEKGVETVSLGSYLMVLQVFGLEKDFLLIAKDDILGQKLQDAKLVVRRRAPKKWNHEIS